MKTRQSAEEFYSSLIKHLSNSKIPFMVGGTYAFCAYTDITRRTKDMDIFTTTQYYPLILQAASELGYKTELFDKNWIAKVHSNQYVVDIIFAEANGLKKVDKTWFLHARKGLVLKQEVSLMPVEEMIRSKSYIQYKERFDGADVVNLVLKNAQDLDWKLLLSQMDKHFELLLSHLINFYFVYPSDRSNIPRWVIRKLLLKFEKVIETKPAEEKVTHGLLISSQYKVAVEKWGYKPIKNSYE